MKNLKEKIKNRVKIVLKNEGKKVWKNGSYSIIMTLIVIAAAVILKLVAAEIPTQVPQFHFSEETWYSGNDYTNHYLKRLDQDVTLYFLGQRDNEDTTVHKPLERLDDLSPHVKVDQKDPVVNPNVASQFTHSDV